MKWSSQVSCGKILLSKVTIWASSLTSQSQRGCRPYSRRHSGRFNHCRARKMEGVVDSLREAEHTEMMIESDVGDDDDDKPKTASVRLDVELESRRRACDLKSSIRNS